MIILLNKKEKQKLRDNLYLVKTYKKGWKVRITNELLKGVKK